MDRALRRAIDASLPVEYRGTGRGWQRMLDDVELRVAVTGSRGKSGLTRIVADALGDRGLSVYGKRTGTDPVSSKGGVELAIDRGRHRDRVRLDETIWEMKRFWPFDAAVVENQAIGEYTMRVFNEDVLRPHYVLVTNVRHDHEGDIASSLEGIAEAIGRSVNPGAVVVSGEGRDDVAGVLRDRVEERGARFVDASHADPDGLPGLENLTIAHQLLIELSGEGLTVREWGRHLDRLDDHYRWRPAARHGLRWFHAADANDVDSTRLILDHLHRAAPGPVSVIGYFRGDRRDRTISFVHFLREHIECGRIDHAWIGGPVAPTATHALADLEPFVHEFPDEPERVDELVERVAGRSATGHVVTIANAVPPFPRAVANALAAEERDAPEPPDDEDAADDHPIDEAAREAIYRFRTLMAGHLRA